MSKKTHLHTETKIKSMELTATATTESKKRKSVIVLQVLIQETGERRIAALGAVHESYDCHKMPGWYSGTVGYHIDEGKLTSMSWEEKSKVWVTLTVGVRYLPQESVGAWKRNQSPTVLLRATLRQ